MIAIKIFYENGDSFKTRINASFEEAKQYYVGNIFNIGVVNDNMQKCTKIDLIKEEK